MPTMSIHFLADIPSGELDQLASLALDGDNLNLLSCAAYDSFSPATTRWFTHQAARYLLPTVELVSHLKELIAGKKAIEIGSGAGDLARFLDISATDNCCQDWLDVRAYYDLMGQPRIKYGSHVERMDALEAIEKYTPDIVIGAWVTQWVDPSLSLPPGGGSIYGVREEELLKKVSTYIVIGAEGIHGRKEIMRHPHQEINAEPIARSRRHDNRIWIWRQ